MRDRTACAPNPSDWQDDELLSLAETVKVFWPSGPLTIASLRTEIRHGRLIPERVAGKIFVTPKAIREMRERCRLSPPQTDRLESSAVAAALSKNEARRKRARS